MCCISASGKSWKRRKTTSRSAVLQRLEPRDVRAARLDEAGLRIGGEEHAALEAVVPREDARQRGQRLFRAVFVVAGEEDDVLAGARPGVPW